MTVGQRINERLVAIQMSQSELARRVGLTQGTIGGLIMGKARSSAHLHRIARELGTTPAYLTGETDDPDENAPPPPPAPIVQHILMPVALPGEAALAQMFEGLLETVDLTAPLDELARELAQILPIGLSRVRGRLTEPMLRDPAPQATTPEAQPSAAGGRRR